MESFIHRQNLVRYVDLLETETDPGVLERLRLLLIEEEDRFGSRRERLEQTDGLIRQGQERVRRQELIVARFAADGRDTAEAQRLLDAMRCTLGLFENYRRRLDSLLD